MASMDLLAPLPSVVGSGEPDRGHLANDSKRVVHKLSERMATDHGDCPPPTSCPPLRCAKRGHSLPRRQWTTQWPVGRDRSPVALRAQHSPCQHELTTRTGLERALSPLLLQTAWPRTSPPICGRKCPSRFRAPRHSSLTSSNASGDAFPGVRCCAARYKS